MLGEINERGELHKLINFLGLKTGVEVGVQKAEYSKYLLDNTKLFLYLVDVWQEQTGYMDPANVSTAKQEGYMQEAIERLKPHEGRYQIIRKFSVDAAQDIADESLDFIYIDAMHTWKAVTADLNAWYPKLRKGGLMSGHDFFNDYGSYHQMCFEVKNAVLEFIEGKDITLYVTQEGFPSWYWVK
jgi:hypothetical protein